MAQARILAFRAKADESFSLISRGNGAARDADFDVVAARLNGLPLTPGSLRGIDEQAAVAAGMEEKSLEFRRDRELYVSASKS